MGTEIATKWVYEFSEGSREMRELLGGKGANVAEMTRVLGPDRVPAGFTITTEACVAYMNAGQQEPEGMAEQVEEALERLQRHTGKRLGDDVDALRELTERFKGLYDFPQDPHEQLRQAIRAVFGSWTGERAVSYRRINRIPDEWGTAVNVQQMVFGNRGERSGSGVAFSRDEVTGAPQPSGDFLMNAQGEDVVSGVRNTHDIAELAQVMPDVHAQLMEILRTLERHYRDMQDVEFTVEEGRLYMLQTRSAKRPAQAAVRFACDAVRERLLSKRE